MLGRTGSTFRESHKDLLADLVPAIVLGQRSFVAAIGGRSTRATPSAAASGATGCVGA